MDNEINEIAYSLLQNEYLRRKSISSDEKNLKNIIKELPYDWFLSYSLEERIKIISSALKNHLDIEEVINIKLK